jgi:hypothetical protein
VPVPSTYLQALDFIHDVKAIQKQPRKRSSLLWPISRMTGYRWVCETMKLAGGEGPVSTAFRSRLFHFFERQKPSLNRGNQDQHTS